MMIPCMVLLCMIFPLQEGSGFVAVKTGSLVIFGSYSSVMFPSVCVEAVERLGELDRGRRGGRGRRGSWTVNMALILCSSCLFTLHCTGEYLRAKGK